MSCCVSISAISFCVLHLYWQPMFWPVRAAWQCSVQLHSTRTHELCVTIFSSPSFRSHRCTTLPEAVPKCAPPQSKSVALSRVFVCLSLTQMQRDGRERERCGVMSGMVKFSSDVLRSMPLCGIVWESNTTAMHTHPLTQIPCIVIPHYWCYSCSTTCLYTVSVKCCLYYEYFSSFI